jgi:hypothetical protein
VLHLRRIIMLAAALATTAALGACGTETIDNADLEEQLGENAGVEPEGVECPDDIEIEEGREFNCTLTAPNGDEVDVDVTLTDDEGGFEAVVPPQQ